MSTRTGRIEVDGEPTVTRAASRDGTEIGYWTSGEGPPLVLVHGWPADHTRWRPLLPWLEPHATVHAMDRRGRGASGDGPDYDLARELEDVAAVVDAVAAASGSAVDLYGHSFGAACALGGATLTTKVRRLAVYEPPVSPTLDAFPPGMVERLDALLAEGRHEAAAEAVFREALGCPMRSSALSGRNRPGRRASRPRTRSLASPVSSSPERSTPSWRRPSPSPLSC
jgi:pimeloyl-ACP methyl ester carboxylesterase